MIIPTGGTQSVQGVHLQRIYNTHATNAVERMSRGDVLQISKFSALVEQGRASAMALPDIRGDLVEKAKLALSREMLPDGSAIAASMIEGQV